jgi:protease I
MSIFGSNKGKEDTLASAPIPSRFKKSKRVAIITGNKVQDLEFFYPYYRLNEAGYDVDVVTPDGGKFEGDHGMGLQTSIAITDVGTGDYELLYLPGGKAPVELRENPALIHFVKKFAAGGGPIAAICHGPQILITAGLVRGKQMACWPEVRGELEKAGGIFVDEALVEDGQFITARMPGDLPRHLAGVLDALEGKLDLTARRDKAA